MLDLKQPSAAGGHESAPTGPSERGGDRPLRVLYIDGDGPFGGSSRSLFEVISGMPAHAVEPHFVATHGTALDFYKRVAKDLVVTRGITKLDNTRYSYYRGRRWLVLLREAFHLPFTVAALLQAKRRWGRMDVIHVNELAYILPGMIAKRLFDAPLVVHVRSMQRVEERSWRCRWFNDKLKHGADVVVAIDENTRSTLPPSLPVTVIQNAFAARRSPQPDTAFLQKLERLRPDSMKVGFVGNLHHSKGVFDLLEAAKQVKAAGRKVDFVIIGGTTINDRGVAAWALTQAGLAQNVQAELHELVAREGMADCFHLLGPTLDIKSAYDRMDVLCFPSHFDAPGRPVFEAAFSAVPAIVAVRNPRPDTLVDRETGIAIPGREPHKLAEAILYFADNPQEVRRMGANAQRLAEANFDPEKNARKLLAEYRRVTRGAASSTASAVNA